MQGEVLSAMMRSVYASFAASAKISVLSVWPVAHPCSSRAERQVATAVPPCPLHLSMLEPNSLANALTLPYLTSHRSSTTLIIFPPPRRASIGPLSDDNQHEAPISTPTLHVGHLHPHQFCSIHGCRPVLIPVRSLRVRPGSYTVQGPCPSLPVHHALQALPFSFLLAGKSSHAVHGECGEVSAVT